MLPTIRSRKQDQFASALNFSMPEYYFVCFVF